MTTGLTARQKARNRLTAAIQEMIADPSLTYAAAAARHGLKRNNVKAAVHRRFGTIEDARAGRTEAVGSGDDVGSGNQDRGADAGYTGTHRWRNCIACGTITFLPRNRYSCDTCVAEREKYHDGAV